MAKKPGLEKPEAGTSFPAGLVQVQAGGCLLRVKVVPKAKRLAVVGVMGDSLKVSLTAAAEKGEANRQLQEFLAATFEVPPSSVVLKAGFTSRNKLVFLPGVDPEQILQRLKAVLS